MRCPKGNREMSKFYNGEEPIIWKCSCGFDTNKTKGEEMMKNYKTLGINL